MVFNDMNEISLDKRAQEILGAVVEQYVQSGEPVGSRTLSQRSPEHLSAATIRNTMADLEHLEFVRLTPRRIVAIIVAETGVIHNKVFETEEDYAQDQLDRAGRFLTETFQGMTLPETREKILAMMAEEKALYDRLLHDALTLGRASVDESAVATEGHHVFLDGAANLLDNPEFADAERLKGLF